MAECGRSSTARSSTLWGVHPFLGQSGPIAIAHRGGAGEAPENTLEAFEIAITLGYTYIETDAHLTRDGVLVAFHDERLDRVTAVSYTHLRAHETDSYIVCRLLLA